MYLSISARVFARCFPDAGGFSVGFLSPDGSGERLVKFTGTFGCDIAAEDGLVSS